MLDVGVTAPVLTRNDCEILNYFNVVVSNWVIIGKSSIVVSVWREDGLVIWNDTI